MFLELSDKNKQKILNYFKKLGKYEIFIEKYLKGEAKLEQILRFSSLLEVEEISKLLNKRTLTKGSLNVSDGAMLILDNDFDLYHYANGVRRTYNTMYYRNSSKRFYITTASYMPKKYTYSYES